MTPDEENELMDLLEGMTEGMETTNRMVVSALPIIAQLAKKIVTLTDRVNELTAKVEGRPMTDEEINAKVQAQTAVLMIDSICACIKRD